ncbi:ft-interacting 1 [Olea europaea subsp. europaea]|uniref:Ft-interacting 1 n=1 Tax=Olea europaea subsp. europaea TaxID=158383 RepID=A0A8S0UPT7_OLEEU|nr:ft-interacting 1 [Olea europaea subsp. europaea]
MVQRYPLVKRGFRSNIKGDIALKIYAVHGNVNGFQAQAEPLQPPEEEINTNKLDEEDYYKEIPEKSKKKKKEKEVMTFYSLGTGPGGAAVGTPPPSAEKPISMETRTDFEKKPDYGLVETRPPLAAKLGYWGWDKISSTYDLVEQMNFLYVHVVKAKDLPVMDISGSLDPYVEVKVGNYKGVTKHFEKNQNSFDIVEVPVRVPPDSPLAPQWYKLENKKGEKISHGEIILAIWMGTQADEAFREAWHFDAHNVSQLSLTSTRSKWNEGLIFVASEPFDEYIILSVEDRIGPGKDEVLGILIIPVREVPQRVDTPKLPNPRWHALHKPSVAEEEGKKKKEPKFASRILLRLSIDAGYHYAWEVYDPCTVITIGAFDNCHINGKDDVKDQKIGKVRIRLSTLETDRIYTHFYPLLVFSPLGLKKHGELHLAIRFSFIAWMNMVTQYGKPLLPKMHYVQPISVRHIDWLRHQAMQIVAARLSRAEPPLRRPRNPPHMDARLSQAENVHPDELDEEFDTFPTSRPSDIVRMRYDRLRSVAGRVQTVMGDLATQGERAVSILSWRDPRATAIFIIFALILAMFLYVTPFQVVAGLAGLNWLRHPRFRSKMPSVPVSPRTRRVIGPSTSLPVRIEQKMGIFAYHPN